VSGSGTSRVSAAEALELLRLANAPAVAAAHLQVLNMNSIYYYSLYIRLCIYVLVICICICMRVNLANAPAIAAVHLQVSLDAPTAFTETKKQSPNTGARANNTPHQYGLVCPSPRRSSSCDSPTPQRSRPRNSRFAFIPSNLPRGFPEFTRKGISALGSLPLRCNSKFHLRVRSLPGVNP